MLVRSPLLPVAIICLMLVIFIIDALTPLDIAIAVLYVVVVLLASGVWQRRGLLVVAGVCMVLTLLAYAGSHVLMFSGPALGRLLVSLAAIMITTSLTLKGLAATNRLLQREESLRRSEAFLAGTQRISLTGSFSFKAPGGEMYWSDQAASIYGYDASVEPDIGRLLARVAPDDAALVRSAFEQALRGDAPLDLRHRLLMPDGTLKYVHVRAQRSRADTDGACEYLGALMDVTAAAQAEQALHNSQAQLAHVTRVTTLGELAASIAHEVNQPLAAISANGEACLRWINRPQPDMDEARGAVTRMLESTTRATEVIRRIRALARKSDPRHAALDLNQVAEETAVLVGRELHMHQVALRMRLEAGLPALLGDRVQLQQVIINLLINGMQAMSGCAPGQAVLTLSTQALPGGGVQLTVADTGAGIPAGHMPRLFEAFYTTRVDGMGMGLPICRSIIEAHGGRIWAQADVAIGATLHFSLPAMEHSI